MQKAGAGLACQPTKYLLASDLERSKDREGPASIPFWQPKWHDHAPFWLMLHIYQEDAARNTP